MARSQGQEKGVAAYGREALSQWANAARYGGRAIAATLYEREGPSTDRRPLRERLDPSKTEKGGRVGDAADTALARFGKPGELASKVSLGSRIVERLRGSVGDGADAGASGRENGGPSGAAVPSPIQESIDVAVPLGGTFTLCSRFLDFPEYLDRVAEVEEEDDSHFVFVAKIGRRLRKLEVEIVDERADERIDWECADELAHSGVLTFHPLAPRLTRIELTIERVPETLPERLARQTRLAGRVIQAELHRFKAHAELLDEDFEEYVPQVATGDEIPSEEEAPPEEEGEEPEDEPLDEEAEDEPLDEEPEDEPLDEEPEDEPLDEEAEDEPLDEEPEELDEGQVEEEELEPA
jgi:uncharacterized membrane protein